LTRTLQSKLKRQRARRQTVFLVFGCTAVVGLALLVFTLTSPHYGEENGNGIHTQTAGEFIQAPEEQQEATDAATPTLSLGVGGDVTFGLAVADLIAQSGPAYPWTEVSPLFGLYDITAVNLEGPLCSNASPGTSQTSLDLRGDASNAAPMAEAGIDALCLANDHIMDYGVAGLEETLSVLGTLNLGAFGAGSGASTAQKPLVIEAENGASIALLSLSDVSSPASAADEDTPGISEASLETIGEMVGAAAQDAHYVAVFVHWGEVGSADVTPRQREIAAACVAAGADLVVGCHPHVVQRIEVISGVPVIYSLGNLVYSSESEAGKNAIFAGCRFSEGRLTSLEIIPLRVEGGKPTPLYAGQAEELLRSLEAASPGVDLVVSPATGTATLSL
jgi:poly-gamma-glutamate capsule biosynthesis protein CapA/YwtB (metallophosphatase superfamily)